MEITGEIVDIRYRNEVNSYTVAEFETDEEEKTFVECTSATGFRSV